MGDVAYLCVCVVGGRGLNAKVLDLELASPRFWLFSLCPGVRHFTCIASHHPGVMGPGWIVVAWSGSTNIGSTVQA